MTVFREIPKADGSGVTTFYRTNYVGSLDLSDLNLDSESIKYRTGLEMSQMTEDVPSIVLCTEDYTYTDQYGTLIAVTRGTIYEMEHGTVVDEIVISGGGGGGGGIPKSNLTSAVSPLEQNVSIKADAKVIFHFLTTALNKTGSAKLYVNNVLKSTMSVTSNNDYEFNVSSYLKLGTNYFTVKTTDDNGAEKTIDFLVNAVQLILTSGFNGSIPIENTFDYIYKINGAGEKTMHFILDGVDDPEIVTASNIDLVKTFTNLSHGVHTLEVYATAELDGTEMESNRYNYSLITYAPGSHDIIMRSNFDTTECMEGELLRIDYTIYNPDALVSNVSMYINEELVLTTTADRTEHTWNVSNYPTGTVVFKIECGNEYIEKTVEVEPLDIDIQEATNGLELKLTTFNRSNAELPETRSVWRDADNDITAIMNNFNWQSNGWINNKLKLTGKANVEIPFQPFATDLRRTGKTIEIEFITYDTFSLDSYLIKCMDNNNIGFDVKVDSSLLASEQQTVSTQFGQGTKIRISFVIEPSNSNRLIKTYINGVLSGLKQYSMDDNFQQQTPTNIIINPDEEEIDITCIRVYNRALNSKEVVNNWIYDMDDITEKVSAFDKNQIYDYYGNISYTRVKNYLPVVTVVGPMPTYKGDKKTVLVRFEHNTKEQYNFEYEGSTIDVQGTSSQYYPRKNWKIKLPEKVQVEDGWLEEKTYCMKADFMESSHTYNIGTARLINDLYESEYYYPTRTVDNGVRDTMNGFPCALFTQEDDESDLVFAGTFMFNNDKADTDTLGYTIDPEYKGTSESWEFKNNTSDHCLFKSADFSAAANPLDDFEARYPDGYEDFTALSRVFEWVVSCKDNPTKFKEEFEDYFDLHYCLIYQVMMELAVMVDSRAKNMFLDTADGVIWYPRFYDMDTCWGLNNEGVPAWSYDVEIHDQIGSAYVWDDRGASEFWNLFEEAYKDEIKQMYHTLREEKLTYENIIRYYVDEISNKFSASEYNEDFEYKYIGPLINEGNATYLYACQGSRQDYFKWFVEKRLYYLDSKYEYGDYNNDYATMRLYTTNGNFTITTYQTMYVKIRFGSTDVIKRIEYNTPTVILAPVGLEFNDTEVIIWGASQIVSFGDLVSKYPGTVDISKCVRLQELILGNGSSTNTNLVSLSLGNNRMIRAINLNGCSNLTGSLDLTGCTDLKVLDIRNTKLSSFNLPEACVIEELYLPDTLTSLTLKNINTLNLLYAKNYTSIKTLIFENTNYSLNDLLSKCGGLTRLRVIFDDDYTNTIDIDGLIYYYENLLGVDENGSNLPHPFFAGTLNVEVQSYHTEEEITQWKNLFNSYYNHLSISYQDIESKFSSYIYLCHTNNKPTYRYSFLYGEEPVFIRELNIDDANTVYNVQRYGYSSPQDTLPTGFFGLWLQLKSNITGMLFLPQKIRGITVDGFYSEDSQIQLSAIFIPSSYKMFDLSYFVKNNMYNSNAGYAYNIPGLILTALENDMYILVQTDKIGYNSYGCRSTTLLSISFGGKVTLLPQFGGQKLQTFVDTTNVKFAGNVPYNLNYETSVLYERPFLPMTFTNMKYIPIVETFSGGNSYLVGTGISVLPTFDGTTLYMKGKSSYDYALYGSLTTDVLDLRNVTIGYPAGAEMINTRGSSIIASSVTTNTLLLNGNFKNLGFVGYSLKVNNPFNASNIEAIQNSLNLPYTTLENPQQFPDLTKIYVIAASNGPIYISAPNLQTIGPHYSQSNYKISIDVDRQLELKQYYNTSYDTSMYFGYRADSANNPWLAYGLECSTLTMGFVLQLGNVDSFGGLYNIGQSFSAPSSGYYRQVSISNFTSSSDENKKAIVLNIMNNLADMTSKSFTPRFAIATAINNLLTDEDRQIATDKGWSVIIGNY